MDHRVWLETHIREGFVKREHVVAIFFDLVKAYSVEAQYFSGLASVRATRLTTPIYTEFYTKPYLPYTCG